MQKKEKAFVAWLAKLLDAQDSDELDSKVKDLGEDKLNELASKFEKEVWPTMEQEVVAARLGAKLDYISMLNGKCPKGYEVEKFLVGGKPCMKCKKAREAAMKKQSVIDSIKSEIEAKKCGGKTKKVKKENGGIVSSKCGCKTPSKGQVSKAKAAIKKHLEGGIIKAADGKKLGFWGTIKSHLVGDEDLGLDRPLGLPWNYYTTHSNGKPIEGTNNNSTFELLPQAAPQAEVVEAEPVATQVVSRQTTQIKPAAKAAKQTVQVKPNTNTSVVDWLAANGIHNYSFNDRKKIYANLFSDKYYGTAKQNLALIAALKQINSSNASQNNARVAAMNDTTPLGMMKQHDNMYLSAIPAGKAYLEVKKPSII